MRECVRECATERERGHVSPPLQRPHEPASNVARLVAVAVSYLGLRTDVARTRCCVSPGPQNSFSSEMSIFELAMPFLQTKLLAQVKGVAWIDALLSEEVTVRSLRLRVWDLGWFGVCAWDWCKGLRCGDWSLVPRRCSDHMKLRAVRGYGFGFGL